jgi:hypothetical protein
MRLRARRGPAHFLSEAHCNPSESGSRGEAPSSNPVEGLPADQSHVEEEMDALWMSFFWTGPIGIGIFLMGLGVLFWGISKVRRP